MTSSASGKYGTSVTRPRNAGLKVFSSSGCSASARPAGVGTGLRVGAELHDQVGAGVGGHQDQRVLEVDVAALAVAELPLSNTW